MARHLLRKSVHSGLASLLTAAPFSSRSRKPFAKKASRPRFTRLYLEPLEDRTLLSASISGTIFNSSLAGQTGLAGQVVYLNKTPSGTNTYAAPGNSTITPTTLGGVVPSSIAADSHLQAAGVPSVITDLQVHIDLTLAGGPNGASAPITVGIISPTGLTVPALAELFNIDPGETFNGTFDGNGTAPFSIAGTQAPGNVDAPSIQPQQPFVNANSEIYNGNPNGTWGLIFFADNPGDNQYLTLHSWSLTFTAPNLSAVTDAQGNYAFTGLPSGTYTASAADSAADVVTALPQTTTFNLSGDQTASGVNFSVSPAPDLTGTAFNVVSTTTNPDGSLKSATIKYTLTNQGNGDAKAFDVDLLLSTDGDISDGSDRLLDAISIPGLAAHASKTGTVTVNLPAGTPAGDYVGFSIHSPSGQTESNTANNSNQGAGVDLALLGGNTNQQITTDSGVQQEPSIAVDPNNPDHIVVAYMDYNYTDPSGLNSGYAGIDLQYSVDGGTNWATSSIALPTGFSGGASNPIVQFDNTGNFYLVFEAATFYDAKPPALTQPGYSSAAYGFQSDNGIFVVTGNIHVVNGQASLNLGADVPVVENVYNPNTATPVFYDVDPDLAVDTSGTSTNGNLYVTWTRFYPAGDFPGQSGSTGGDQIMIAVSKDGASWMPPEVQPNSDGVSVISDPNAGTSYLDEAGFGYDGLAHVTVGPQGDVYVSGFGGNVFTVYHSFNAAQSFTPPDYGNDFNLPFGSSATEPLSSLFTDAFRTLPVRDIVADPTDPGRVYAVEATAVDDTALGGDVNAGTIVFAVSNDYGLTWQNMFTVGANATNFADLTPTEQASFFPVLNDDNGGNYLGDADIAQLNNAVIAGQALPSLAVDPTTGDLTVIWYDARTDPGTFNGDPGTLLSVFGTVSTDGGSTFSPNFAVATQNFNPYNGVFVDGNKHHDGFIGDYIGVAASNGVAYAVWTATDGTDGVHDGQQHIFFDKYDLTPAPQPPADRFSPNNTLATATNIGSVTAQEIYSFLNLPAGGSNEWFQLTAGATGDLSVTVGAASGGNNLQIEVTDANGKAISTGSTPLYDPLGNVIGQEIDITNVSVGMNYYIHVFTAPTVGTSVSYTLTVEALTADLGTQVEGSAPDTTTSVASGGTNIYRLVTGVAGTLDVTLTGNADVSGALNLSILAADGQTVLTSDTTGVGSNGTETLSIQATAGQLVFLQVSGANLASASGDFTLAYTNFDQFETSGISTLFIPTVGDPTSITAANLGGSATSDLLYDNTSATDALSVLKSNGDGTFQASQDYDIGPGQAGDLGAGNREIGVADFTNNGATDVIVPNFRAGDVSVLLGNGAGGFEPQRIFNAVTHPDSLVTGDFGNGEQDAAVLENFLPGAYSQVAILLGRGDGTFGVPSFLTTIFNDGANSMVAGDFGNGTEDIIVFSKNDAQAELFVGNGAGTFNPNGIVFTIGEPTFTAAGQNLSQGGATDKNGNPIYDTLVTTSTNSGDVYVQSITFNKMTGAFDFGTLTLGTLKAFPAMPRSIAGGDVGVNGLVITDFMPSSGLLALSNGIKYGTQNIVVTAQLRGGQGAAEVILLPELLNPDGSFNSYGAPIVLADVGTAGNIVAGHFVSANETDLAVADKGGITILYGKPLDLAPNTTKAAARNLGSADHIVAPTQAIVTGYEDAYFTYTAPTVASGVIGSGPQVIDFSALIQYVGGAGLEMDVTDASGKVIHMDQFFTTSAGTGIRFQVTAAQGETLYIHIFGLPGGAVSPQGYGAYTLDVDVLPQVVSVEAESAIPGGPATSLVLTVQGDTLDPTSVANATYSVVYQGPNGPVNEQLATTFVTVIVNGQAKEESVQDVVYDPDASVAVAGSGLSYLAEARQTITLDFASALPAGSYEIMISGVQTAAYSTTESSVLVTDPVMGLQHDLVAGPVTPVGLVPGPNDTTVAVSGKLVSSSNPLTVGVDFTVPDLVPPAGTPIPTAVGQGSPFLTQLPDDLSAILNSGLQNGLTDQEITDEIDAEISSRFMPGFNAAGGATTYAIIWLDPVSLGVQAPQGTADGYSLVSNMAATNISQSYVSVGGNVEVVVLAGLAGTFKLDVGNVPADARGGVVVLDSLGSYVQPITSSLQTGVTDFTVTLAVAVNSIPPLGGTPPGQGAPNGGPPTGGESTPSGGIAPANSIAQTATQTVNALVFSALLAGFPETSTGQGNGGQTNGNANPTTGSSQTTAGGLASTAGADGGGSGSGGSLGDGHSSFVTAAIDGVFADFPDSVSGFIDVADGWLQDGENAAKILAERLNAILKMQKPIAPTGMPPESLQPAPQNGPANKATTTQGESKAFSSFGPIAGAAPMEEHHWRAHEYALTLFLASGLYYVGLRDLNADESRSRKKRL